MTEIKQLLSRYTAEELKQMVEEEDRTMKAVLDTMTVSQISDPGLSGNQVFARISYLRTAPAERREPWRVIKDIDILLEDPNPSWPSIELKLLELYRAGRTATGA